MKNSLRLSADSRNQAKVLKLRMALGAAGYGVYIMLLERLCSEPDGRFPLDYDLLAFDFQVDKKLIQAVIEDFDLFTIADDLSSFSSPVLAAKSPKRAERERVEQIDKAIADAFTDEALMKTLAELTGVGVNATKNILQYDFRKYAVDSGIHLPIPATVEHFFRRFFYRK